MNESTTSQEFFDAIYSRSDDPWDFASSEYERSRYNAILGALGTRRFNRAFEPGCSVGVLTYRLAAIAQSVEAIDLSPLAVGRAQQRCAALGNVTISQGSLPEYQPAAKFDLIVFCEIGYYFDLLQLIKLVPSIVESLEPGGVFLAEHWLGVSKDHLLSGDQVHQVIGRTPALQPVKSQRFRNFRLGTWMRI